MIAKLDRLSHNAHFLLGLQEAGVDFVCADMPTANRLTVGIMAMLAEEERRMISKRTKDALAAAKRRGVKLGGDRGVIPSARAHKASAEALQERAARRAADLAPIIAELQAAGVTSLTGIAAALNEKEIATPRGNGLWMHHARMPAIGARGVCSNDLRQKMRCLRTPDIRSWSSFEGKST